MKVTSISKNSPSGFLKKPLLFLLVVLSIVLFLPLSSWATPNGDAAYDGYNSAFLVRLNGETYHKTSTADTSRAYFWTQATEIQVVVDTYLRSGNAQHKQLVSDLLDTFLSHYGSSWVNDGYNDDIGWATLGCIRGYEVTGKASYLTAAGTNWNMAYNRGWDSSLGGGIWWSTGKTNKNILANNSMMIVACELYVATGDATYLTKAKAIYAWVRSSLYDPTTGKVYSKIDADGTLDTSVSVYNEGAFVDAANYLYSITGDISYYNDALLTVNYVVNSTTILSNTSRGESLWAYRFVRALHNFAQNNNAWGNYYTWMLANANASWNMRRTDYNITWNSWKTPTLTDDCSSYECASGFAVQQLVPDTQPGFTPAINQLSGTVIGSAAAGGNTITNAFDGDLSTYFYSANSSGNWVGLDLGSSQVIGQVSYAPRPGNDSLMIGGIFQGDNDPSFSTAVTLFTITTAPPDGMMTSQTITNTQAFRYVRYVGPTGAHCNVAELKFYAPNPPGTPTGLAASVASSTHINLSWTAGANATSYNVKRSTVNGGPYTTLATGVTSPSYSDIGLSGSTTYYYVVSAVGLGGDGVNSTQASALTLPTKVVGVAAVPGNAQVSLSWTSAAGVTSYVVKRSTISGGPYTTVGTPTTASFTNTGLTNGTTYYYVVAGVDASGTGAVSAEVSATPLAPVLLSQGKPATASSVQTGNDIAFGNDGNLTTRWSAVSPAFPAWWKVDLGASHNLSSVAINWYNGSTRSYKYRIEVSSDNVTFTTVADKTGNTVIGNTTDNVSATARYVRITITGASAGWPTFNECQVYGN